MALSPQFSSEFLIRVKAVSEAPDDYYVKAETLGMLMQMKALAACGDAMAQYRLAQVYPKNSVPYLTWMEASATQGFTNAMLELSLAFATNGTPYGLRQAASYLVKILASDDSYIKSEARALIERNRLLAADVNRQLNCINLGNSSHGFFAPNHQAVENEQPNPSSISTPQA